MTGWTDPIPLRPDIPEHRAHWHLDLAQLRDLDALSTRLFAVLSLEGRLRAICDFWVPTRARWAVITLHDVSAGTSRVAAAAHREHARARNLLAGIEGELTGSTARFFPEDGVAEIALLLAGSDRAIGMVHVGLEPGAGPIPDGPFTECIAARCAAALANSQQYEAQLRVAQTFQNAALEVELPAVKGMRFDAFYEAGKAEALVGGDWYDAFQVEDGRIVLSIGDVAGSGLEAAISMMNVRQAIRGTAQVHPDPSVMLSAAERTLLHQHKGRLVTALVMVLDPVTQQCSYASAGHPPALLRTPDGSVHQLNGTRFPLGVGSSGDDFSVYHAALPPESMLLLYTDGLIESTRDILEGEAAVRAALAAEETSLFDRPARLIRDKVLGTRARDDVAILTVSFESAKEVERWRFDPMWADAGRRVRDEIRQTLGSAGFGKRRLLDYDVIFSELLSNIIRYASGTVEVILEKQSDRFVLHILDKGPGFLFIPRLPPDLFSEFGRGLFLIAKLALNFSVERRPGGGSHARVVLASSNGDQ